MSWAFAGSSTRIHSPLVLFLIAPNLRTHVLSLCHLSGTDLSPAIVTLVGLNHNKPLTQGLVQRRSNQSETWDSFSIGWETTYLKPYPTAAWTKCTISSSSHSGIMRKFTFGMKVTHIGEKNLRETELEPVVSWSRLAPTSSREPIVKFSGNLWAGQHVGSLILATVEVFTPQKSADTKNQGLLLLFLLRFSSSFFFLFLLLSFSLPDLVVKHLPAFHRLALWLNHAWSLDSLLHFSYQKSKKSPLIVKSVWPRWFSVTINQRHILRDLKSYPWSKDQELC